MATCPNCGNQTGEGAIFCDQCGTRIPAPEAAAPEAAPAPAGGSVICEACGAGNVPGEAFCDFCGSPLEAPVPTAEAEPVAADAEEEPPAAEAVEEPAVEEAPAGATCPACGAAVLPDEAFCADCGASLAEAPLPPEPVAEVEVEAEAEPVVEEPAAEPVAEAAAEAAEEAEAEPEAEAAPAEAAPVEPVEEAVPEPVVEEAPPPAPAGPPSCPACGTEVEEGDTFCSNCGAVLKEAEVPAPVEAAVPVEAPPAAAGPRLVVSASGAEIPLVTEGELLIGREDPVSGIYPEIDLTPHGGEDGGVSRRHAKLIIEAGATYVEDLDSTNFTFVNKQKVAAKTRHQLNDGDELRCGRVALVFRA